METKKKLIEVALPLDEINEACVRDKLIKHGHPSTLHLWWARRPITAARAVIWASLVDDPSSHPEQFPTIEEQDKERERLFEILKKLIIWENSNNEEVLKAAEAEIMKSTDNNPPALLDPFAGGGAIPFEASRLGLKAYAADLNPVAVMLNKAMIEIPAKFQGKPPVNPDAENDRRANIEFPRSSGLAKDIEYYGNLLRKKTCDKIGHLYPKVKYNDSDGQEQEASVIAWLWARSVKCPNPICNVDVPLVHSFDLMVKKGKEYHVEVDYLTDHKLHFSVHKGKSKTAGTVDRKGAVCPCCGEPIKFEYVREKSCKKLLEPKLMAIVAESPSGRLYLSPDSFQAKAGIVDRPFNVPEGNLTLYPRNLNTPAYGYDSFDKLFCNRQLVLLTTLCETLQELRKIIIKDSKDVIEDGGVSLADGGSGAAAYAEAILVYLSFVIDKTADYNSSFCSWDSSLGKIRNVFGRQAIPMVWDYAEANPFSDSTGSMGNMLKWILRAVENFPLEKKEGEVVQWDATQDNGLRNIMVSTDPPYYDNIPYAYLADFFYVWMRRSLRNIYPNLFSTCLTPKENELTALSNRFDGSKERAKSFFEDGMSDACKNIYEYSREDIPVTIYYAFKQSDTDDEGTASSGWETMLSAIINAGFSITGTWPMRTEMCNRNVVIDTNALASSIVIVCRKNKGSKQVITMKGFLDELRSELGPAIRKLQASNIAPVDLAQSAIGPGIAVYSRYKQIVQADGSSLSVRDALKLINKELDEILNNHDSDMDPESGLCLSLFTQYGYNECSFGDANTLANARNISVDALDRIGIVKSGKGKVRVLERSEIKPFSSKINDNVWLLTQQAVKAFEDKGYSGIAEVFAELDASMTAKIKKLCYQLFAIAEKKKWADEAVIYNSVITSWDDAVSAVGDIKKSKKEAVQLEFDLEG